MYEQMTQKMWKHKEIASDLLLSSLPSVLELLIDAPGLLLEDLFSLCSWNDCKICT